MATRVSCRLCTVLCPIEGGRPTRVVGDRASAEFDPITGMPWMGAVPVSIEPL